VAACPVAGPRPPAGSAWHARQFDAARHRHRLLQRLAQRARFRHPQHGLTDARRLLLVIRFALGGAVGVAGVGQGQHGGAQRIGFGGLGKAQRDGLGRATAQRAHGRAHRLAHPGRTAVADAGQHHALGHDACRAIDEQLGAGLGLEVAAGHSARDQRRQRIFATGEAVGHQHHQGGRLAGGRVGQTKGLKLEVHNCRFPFD